MFEGIDLEHLPAALEAMLFVTDEPVDAITLANMFDENVEEIELALETLQRKLDDDARGIQLREVAGGWRLYTHPAFHELIEKYVLSWDTRRMSSAALEVLGKGRQLENDMAVTWCSLAELYDKQDPLDERVGQCMERAWAHLNAEDLAHDGYHALTIRKCLPCFDYFGYFLYVKELKERLEEIRERT